MLRGDDLALRMGPLRVAMAAARAGASGLPALEKREKYNQTRESSIAHSPFCMRLNAARTPHAPRSVNVLPRAFFAGAKRGRTRVRRRAADPWRRCAGRRRASCSSVSIRSPARSRPAPRRPRRRRPGRSRCGRRRVPRLVRPRPQRAAQAPRRRRRRARAARRRLRRRRWPTRPARPTPGRRFNVALAAAMLREAAAMTTQVDGEIIPSDRPGVDRVRAAPAGRRRARRRAVERAGRSSACGRSRCRSPAATPSVLKGSEICPHDASPDRRSLAATPGSAKASSTSSATRRPTPRASSRR